MAPSGGRMTAYIPVVVALLAIIALVVSRRGRKGSHVIQKPSLGTLNLAGSRGEDLLAQDMALIGPVFGTVRKSAEAPPPCDVLLLYCEIDTEGSVKSSARSLRGIIRDAGAAVVVVAMNNTGESYIAAARQRPFDYANVVMTIDRKGAALPTFLSRLFQKMNAGTPMPVAWNELAPQIPGVHHADAPDAIF